MLRRMRTAIALSFSVSVRDLRKRLWIYAERSPPTGVGRFPCDSNLAELNYLSAETFSGSL